MAPGVLGNLGEGPFNFRRWGALGITLGELGSKLIVWGLREPCQKVKNKLKKSQRKGKASIYIYIF